jgi:nucleotide-binding universal stress UspA family protein
MKIMVGYDRSNVAKEALEIATKHAKAFDAKVHVLTSLARSPEMEREDIQKAEHELKNVKIHFEESGISCTTENDIGEIVIGVKRRSKVGKLLFGSNAQYVILQAPCPVVTVK